MYGKGVRAKNHAEASRLSGAASSDRRQMRARAQAALDVLRGHKLVDGARVAAIGYCFGGKAVLELARSGADVAGVVSFHGSLDAAADVPSQPITAKILVCHGGDDGFVASAVPAFQDEMRRAKADWQMITYGGAVHSFTVPSAGDNPSLGMAYNADADRRSWQAMQNFFTEIFAK
jgi:dienelactone hydrolase